jgi:hypothetical protein
MAASHKCRPFIAEGAASRVDRGEGLGKGGFGRLRGARRERVVKVHNFAVQV